MEKSQFFRIFFSFCLAVQIASIPLPASDDFCSGKSVLNFENNKAYTYAYETNTTLFINDVSDEAKSSLVLKTNVVVSLIDACTYLLRLEQSSLVGESISKQAHLVAQLNNLGAVFRLNAQGELDSNIKFDTSDSQSSRNIKRAIVSAFQIKSEAHLRSVDGEKSAVVYETDVLGRCRTTYTLNKDATADTFSLDKKKSLHRCTLNNNRKSNAVQSVPYKSLPEFFQGRLFIEDFSCTSSVKSGVVDSVNCREVSTYKIGSRGPYGVQAIVYQSLTFVQVADSSASSVNTDSFVSKSIAFEHDESNHDLIEPGFNVDQFVDQICKDSLTFGLTNEHANNFRDLAVSLRTQSVSQLTAFYQASKSKCALAGLTVSQALVFANSDNSIEAVLSLLDSDEFADQKYITEYPILTALARVEAPSAELINKFSSYLSQKSDDFAYLNKLYLVYSAIVNTHCQQSDCSAHLADWTQMFAKNFANDCADSSKQNIVVASLKAVGNIGFFADASVLERCAANKQNTQEVRVNAIQSLRRFACGAVENLEGAYSLLQDRDEDAEIRINAFLSLMRCSDQSAKFATFAADKLGDFLLNEDDSQVLTFIIDYGKEHGLTSILNAALSDPRIREKFAVNFKELSWNNYRYTYDVMRDAAVEVETSVIYTSKTFVPRSVRFNVTLHMHGASINFMDANLRLEGLDEVLKAIIIDKLRSEALLKRVLEKPEQLIELLQIVADKLKYVSEKPQLSLSLRIYGSDVFYSKLDEREEFFKLSSIVMSARERLYRQVLTIKNVFLFNSHVTQPLANGLGFNTQFEVSAGVLVSKASSKTNVNDELNFDLDNFYSSSIAINHKYEVTVDSNNKLSLKKKAFLNARLKLSLEGSKATGNWKYNLNLSPMEKIPIFVFDGKFYKLSANSKYKEVTQFKTERKEYKVCNSDRFKTTVGVELCLSVQRPKFGNVVEILKQRRQGDLEEEFESYYEDMENDDEDDDDVDNVKRPRLRLAGPYHYEVTLNNPQLLKSIQLNVVFNKSPENSNFDITLSTKSQQDQIVDRLALTYSRERSVTLRDLAAKVNVELKVPATNEVKFKATGSLNYRKSEVFEVNVEVENKIVRVFHHKLSLGRVSSEENVIPKYYMQLLTDSQSANPRKYNLAFDLSATGKDISSNFIAETTSAETNNENVKLAEGTMTLKSNDDSKTDYTLVLHGESARQAKLDINGHILWGMFRSNVELSVDFRSPNIALPRPISVQFGHSYDGSENARNYILARLDVPMTRVNHTVKTTFVLNVATNKLSLLEVEITRPSSAVPVSVYYERTVKNEGDVTTSESTFGLRNVEIDLASSESSIASTLVKVDDQTVLRTLAINLAKVHDKAVKKVEYQMSVSKNGNSFVTLRANAFGNVAAIKSSLTELPRQSLGAELYIKILENSGAISTKLDLEASAKNKKYETEFSLKCENLFRILTRLDSIKSKFSLNGQQVKSEFEVKRLGEVKGYKLTASGTLRAKGSVNEFDLGYEKRLANGKTVKATGQAKYSYTNLKNFDASVSIKNHFESRLLVENKRNDDSSLGYHNFEYTSSHFDHDASERRYQILVNNRTENGQNQFDFAIIGKNGELNKLNNRDSLSVLVDLSSKNTFSKQRKLVKSVNTVGLKLKRFNLDVSSGATLESQNGISTLNSKSDMKFPAMITDPGKLNQLSHKLDFSVNSKFEIVLKSTFNTDSKLFGRVFRVLNTDLNRKIDASGSSVNTKLAVGYRLAKSESDAPLTNVQVSVDHDYIGKGTFLNVNVKQDRLGEIDSRLKPGTKLQISDCTYAQLVNKEQSESKLFVEGSIKLTCNNVVLSESVAKINRFDASTRAEIVIRSDILYEERSLKLAHDKFTEKSGLVGFSYNMPGRLPYANEFSYTRALNVATNRLDKANYRLSTSFGADISKVCDLNIEVRDDYFNSLSCRLNSTKVPDIELTYGYNLKVAGIKDFIYGKRGYQLDVIIPGRTLRATYKATYPSYLNDDADDDEEDNEKEFNAAATLQWNLLKDPSKSITVNVKRDNTGKGKSVTTIQFLDTPHFKQVQFQAAKIRTSTQTNLVISGSYETQTGAKNALSVDAKFSSDMDTNSFSLETNLVKPSFNTLYENRFNKNNGRLEFLGIRVGKVLKLSVDKEFDPEQRLVSLQFVNPDESKYQFTGKSNLVNNVYVVEGVLSQNGNELSQIVSKFDSVNNDFDVVIKGVATKNAYRFNFGVFNESLVNAFVLNQNDNKLLGKASLQVAKDANNQTNLVLSLKWNRLWKSIQQEILGAANSDNLADTNEKFNSYFGDVYSQLTSDLKKIVEENKDEKSSLTSDFANFAGLLLDFYSNYLSKETKAKLEQLQMQKVVAALEEQLRDEPQAPLYKRALERYNEIAHQLTVVSLELRKYSKALSTYVPRLPTYEYNQDESAEFANNFVLSRPTLNAKNLYQFNAEYRNYLIEVGKSIISYKLNKVRSNMGGIGVRALINKYKYRPLSDYTVVGHVFNKRNIIAFDGESIVLQAQCKYLLAHETQKNRFSVVLNFDKSKYPISVFAYGQKSVDIGYDSAAINSEPTALPRSIALGEHGQMVVKKNDQGVCVELVNEFKVCCYDDSKSCTVAATRWYTGKLNGLLGKADNNIERINQADWFLKNTCTFPNANLKKPTELAVKTCYSMFGRHRQSLFRNAIQAIKPDGWQKVCESVLTANLKQKCSLMKAFVHHSRQESIEINALNECYSCNLKNSPFSVGQSVAKNAAGLSSNFEKGSDVVFVILPCDKSQFAIDYSSVVKSLDTTNNRYYAVKLSQNDASIYQAASGELFNFNLQKAQEALSDDKTVQVSQEAFKKGLILAASLFSQRLAENRVLIVKSCGNCLPSSFLSGYVAKKLADRNIVVHSWGLYDMKNVDEEDSADVPFGYDSKNIFLFNKEEQKVDSDYLENFKINHKLDFCQSIAAKTSGQVVNLALLNESEVANQVTKNLFSAAQSKKFTYKLGSCEKLDTPYGDWTDFSYSRKQVKAEESD